MKCFKIDENGDVIFNKNDKKIEIVEGTELIKQRIQTVLGTNKKEWDFNKNEGINFKNIITKNPDIDLIKNEIQEGLRQVDETFILTDFSFYQKNRKAVINFLAVNSKNETVSSTISY